jgi:hypothetical protein
MKSLFRPFPLPLTGRQWFYIGVLQGVGAGVSRRVESMSLVLMMYSSSMAVRILGSPMRVSHFVIFQRHLTDSHGVYHNQDVVKVRL